MVKYQFTSQDSEQQTIQLERLQDIVEKQAKIIEKLENNNNDLRLQVEKLSLLLEKQQDKYSKDSNLFEIKDQIEGQDGSIMQPEKIEKAFVQNSQSLFPVHIEQTIHQQTITLFNQQPFKLNNIQEDSDICSKNEQQQDQSKVNDQSCREQQQSQLNDSSRNSSLIQNNIQQNQKKSNPFAVDDSAQSVEDSEQNYNIFGQPKKNDQPQEQQQTNLFQINQPPENQNEAMILEEEVQEEEEEEPLMFGDPSSIFYKNPIADQNKVDKACEFEEIFKGFQINENQEANSQQNIKDKSDGSGKLNQDEEDLQFEENNEESI
ncbi:unnamed protein product [Paramecium octaurelia]|uniref:Uncharacterized protein n=1 Tax=Paramecium octaurelia TaxID=43137 RepID=A0A8S1SKR3_PAROT|nr:unnamed protein product [Paramecium octaurelia]